MNPRTVAITGAGRGLGKAYAIAFAAAGFCVIVNDLGVGVDGTGPRSSPAEDVVDEIRRAGGDAVADFSDVSDPEGADALIDHAVETYGALHTLVNNAGIIRDKTLVNLTVEDFDDVIRVHLRGTFLTSRAAARHWRTMHGTGRELQPRLINTTSNSGLFGNFGQTNYGAAKAGIASMTQIHALELARYDVLVNAIAPGASTRMTQAVETTLAGSSNESRDADDLAPLVVWLGSPRNTDITGTIFLARGHSLAVARPWTPGTSLNLGRRWRLEDLDVQVPGLVNEAHAES
ncbi:MAG TPA: SDR family NAD(P)-dependent oxidoreductase [Galbitalea sp.]|jgi:NAD(P)-dependent dehydrogenase (short-subunit alcohol dehydrogenase family)|nr:SDR family NAD(P)-dependent oxidoreductase [Galbitalea sp.]